MRHQKWIDYCFKIVEKSKSPHYKHVSVLIKNNRILGVGFNKPTPGYIKNRLYSNRHIHAELDLLNKINENNIHNAILYTVGISKAGNVVHACPCPLCQQLIREYNLKAVYYANKQGEPERLNMRY